MLGAVDEDERYFRFLSAREKFREDVYAEKLGEETDYPAKRIANLLRAVNGHIRSALEDAIRENGNIVPTFFAYEITSEKGAAALENLEFRCRKTAQFLEANAKVFKVNGLCDGKAVYGAVKKSKIYDAVLKTYKTSEPLEGRART